MNGNVMSSIVRPARVNLVFLFVLLAFFLHGCSDNNETPASLRIGIHAWPGYEPLHLSKSLGHLDERIKLVEFASASSVIRAFKNGSIDGATLTMDEALVVKHSGIDIKVVLINDFSAGGDAVLLNPRYANNGSLKGLKIGVEGGAVGAYTLSRALESQGLTLADVTPVQLKPIEQREPLGEGVVDGVVTFEPYRSLMLGEGAVEVFSSRDIPGEIVDVTVLTHSAINNNQLLQQNLIDAWYETVDFIKSQPEMAHNRMAQRQHISAEEVKQELGLIHLPARSEAERLLSKEGELRANTERLMRFMVSQHLLPESMDTNSLFR